MGSSLPSQGTRDLWGVDGARFLWKELWPGLGAGGRRLRADPWPGGAGPQCAEDRDQRPAPGEGTAGCLSETESQLRCRERGGVGGPGPWGASQAAVWVLARPLTTPGTSRGAATGTQPWAPSPEAVCVWPLPAGSLPVTESSTTVSPERSLHPRDPRVALLPRRPASLRWRRVRRVREQGRKAWVSRAAPSSSLGRVRGTDRP